MERKYFIICLVFGVWTIIQTSLHLVGVIYAYFWSVCEKSPADAQTIFVYLTYLYNSGCAKPKLRYGTWSSLQFNSFRRSDDGNSTSLEEVVSELLDKLDCFPDKAAPFTRTSVFLLSFMILDGTWMVSAVSLIMGTIFDIRESLSLAFFGPWLVMTVCVCIADAIASVFFGFDITNTANFDSWTSFVGIADLSQCDNFSAKNGTDQFFVIPSLVFCSISTRFVLVWISNWIGFVFVVKATISVYHESYKNEAQNRHYTDEVRYYRDRTDQNTFADRIRNWQLFYGTADAADDNSNSVEEVRPESGSSGDNAGASGSESAVAAQSGTRCLDELRGQLPWSYIEPQDDAKGTGGERIAMENRAKGRLRIKSNSSDSGTEL